MAAEIHDFTASTADWRWQLQKNKTRTRFVIFSFIFLYMLIGLIVDIALINPGLQVPLWVVMQALLTFQVFPIAMVIMGIIAFISLWATYVFHDRIMLLGTEYYEITPESARNLQEKQIYNVVEEMKVAAGLNYMPKVYLIEADYMNAFASGYSEKSAMVAITRGLLEKLDRSELQAVMAHEVSHIRHYDIKLTLMASVLSNIMLVVLDLLFYSVIYSRDSNGERRGDGRLVAIIMILRYTLPLITVLLTLYLSRTREYMADAGCVELMRDNSPLARALLKIHRDHEAHSEDYNQAYGDTAHEEVRRAAYLYDPTQAGINITQSLSNLFSTHPAIQDRLAALGFKPKRS